MSISNKKSTLAIICFLFGGFGVHRYMVGKFGTGLLMLFTGGGLVIWWLRDFLLILRGNFTDKQGNKISSQPSTNLVSLPNRFIKHLKKYQLELSMVGANCFSADNKARSFYVTSSFNGEGKTTTAISMAYALSMENNAEVLLIDGSIDSPKLHQRFRTNRSPGLSESLYGDSSLEDIIKKTTHNKLSLITCGLIRPRNDPTKFSPLGNEKLNELLTKALIQFDYVVFDGHSLLNSARTVNIAHHFDGMILVVECERTKWEVVQMASDKALSIGANVLAVVLNRRKYYIPKFLYDRI